MYVDLSHFDDLIRKKTFDSPRVYIFWTINIVCPLIIAISLYLVIHKDGLFDLAERLCPIFHYLRTKVYHEIHPQNVFEYFIKYQLGDLLWAYALECALILSCGNLSKALLYGMFWSSVTELFQLFPFVHATFDILDMIAQLVGVVIAYIMVCRFYIVCVGVRSIRKIQE